jgi:hypothetical protein
MQTKTKRVPFDTVADGELFIWRGMIMQRVNNKTGLAVHHGTRFAFVPNMIVEVYSAD